MKITLVFPPRTSPTYMPMGIACLMAVAKQHDVNADFLDANLELWSHTCASSRELAELEDFCHSRLDHFLRQENYEAYFRLMPQARRIIDSLERKAKHYVETGELDAELAGLLLRQSIAICRDNPDIIAFSTMYADQLCFMSATSRYLKEYCDHHATIIAGGAVMSALSPQELIRALPWIDAILVGEGETTFSMLLGGVPLERIPGAYVRKSIDSVITSRPNHVKDLSSLPFPDFSAFSVRDYFNPVPVFPMLGGRGCKWRRCAFCSHNASFGPHRTRYPLHIVHEMIRLQEVHGCRHFYFADQYVDPRLLEGLSDAIIAAGLKCRFHVMARTIKEYTPEILAKAAAAGCRWISWGMESGSHELLSIMNKGTNPGDSGEVIRAASDCGISNLLMMIFGAPGSNITRLEETFAFLDRVFPYIDAMTASAFVLFDNTPFSRNAKKYGLEVIGNDKLLEVNGNPVHSAKLRFKRQGEPGNSESPLAAEEIELWERRKVWMPELPFIGRLCCEHYLLYSDDQAIEFRPKRIRKGA